MNKFEKLVHLVGFIIRNLTRCTVTWTSNSLALHKPSALFDDTAEQCVESRNSLPFSHNPITGSSPEPHESSAHSPILLSFPRRG